MNTPGIVSGKAERPMPFNGAMPRTSQPGLNGSSMNYVLGQPNYNGSGGSKPSMGISAPRSNGRWEVRMSNLGFDWWRQYGGSGRCRVVGLGVAPGTSS